MNLTLSIFLEVSNVQFECSLVDFKWPIKMTVGFINFEDRTIVKCITLEIFILQ